MSILLKSRIHPYIQRMILLIRSPDRALLNPYTIVYDRAQPNTLRITVVFLRNTWLSITIVILRVVYDRS